LKDIELEQSYNSETNYLEDLNSCISFDNVNSPSLTVQLMVKTEINYLDKMLSTLLEDFK